ncbi:aminotransferase class V-fold PLP-dependent enzyme [Candidatus Wolfebacteria bacterium]|nr:aminotransferase class V-fold PLP-dependent enzyme [Candidatus Wolfebacteria bacterium]
MKLFKKPIFVYISPNAQLDDIWLALKLIFSPWRWGKGEAIQEFTEKFKKYLGAKSAFVFDSGRTSFYAILESLNLKEGDEILVQALNCTAAVNPILWAGAKPIYVDIEQGDYNMSPDDLLRKISSRSKAVIMQHTFGFPAKVDEILEIAKKNNLVVIEDVAHALGAEYKNKKLGSFGDAAFFSFGRFKIISTVSGGAAIAKNPEIRKGLKKFYESYNLPSRFWIFQQLFHPVFLAIAKPLYNVFSMGKVLVVLAKKLNLISLTVYPDEKQGGSPGFGPWRMPNALTILGLNQLEKLEEYNDDRRALAQLYEDEFQSYEAKPRKIGKSVFLYFPIQLKNRETADSLIEAARKQGIYLEDWPGRSVIGPIGTNLEKIKYKLGSCPVAEETAMKVVVLPTSPNTRKKDVKRVIDFIKELADSKS